MIRKKITMICLAVTMIFSNVIVANAGIKETEKTVINQTDEKVSDISNYDELVKELSDSFMTNDIKKFQLSKELSNEIMKKDLIVDVMLCENKGQYDLNNIVDIMYLEYVGQYNPLDTGLTYQINALNTNYNKELSLDYEDYYSSILSNIDINNLTAYEKVYYIHKYICDSFEYDPEYESEEESGFHNDVPTIQTSMYDRKFICGNYSVMMKDLLNRAGVDCIIVLGLTSKNAPHAWNLVKIDDKWYWVDATWDDYNNTNAFLLNGNDSFLSRHKVMYAYEKSLESYNISKTDYEGKLIRPYITGISISKKKILHVDYQINGATKCDIYVDKKKVSNNKKISFKNGSTIQLKFNDKNKTSFLYKIYKINGSFKLLRIK